MFPIRNTLLALTLLILSACSGESSQRHIAKAKNYINDSNYPSAILELQSALQQDTSSPEARWLLGNVYLKTGDILAAENQLRRAQDLGWSAEDTLPALAKALLAQGKSAEVIKLDYKGLTPVTAALLLSTQSIARGSQGDFEEAAELVALALQNQPGSVDAKLAEATIALQKGDASRSLALLDTILAAAPDTGEAWWLRAQALRQSRKLEDARAAVDKSIALLNQSVEAYLIRALIDLDLGDYAAAQADSDQLIRLAPRNPSGQYVLGLLHFQRKEYRKAITALTLAEPMALRFPSILFYLSRAHLGDQDLDLAANFAKQFVALAPDDSNGRTLLAAILMQQKKAGEAKEILQPVLDRNPHDARALNIMANALLLNDQADIGIELYVRIRQLQPEWRIVPLLQETALVGSDAVLASGELTVGALETRSNFLQTQILQIMKQLEEKDFQGAIESAKSYQFQDLESLAPYRVLGMVYLAAGQPNDARAVFNKALTRQPDDVFTHLSLAQMSLQTGDIGQARKHYQTVLDQHPEDLATLLQLSALEAKENNSAAMVASLQQAIAAHPTVLEPRFKLAAYYLTSGRPQKVEPLFATLGGLQRGSPRVLELVTFAQLAQKQYESALLTAQQLAITYPESAQSHFLLAQAYSEADDSEQARQELLEALKRDPNHVPALIHLARTAHQQGEREEFEQYLAAVVELAPENHEVRRLRALSAKAQGNKDEALALLQLVAGAAPSTQAVLQLSALQQEMGKNAAASKLLQQWTKNHPNDVDAHLALAFALELGDDRQGAQSQYLAVMQLDPGNIDALNNLAWNLRLEDPDKALEYIRRAVLIAPELPEVLDTLAVIEHLRGDQVSAQRSIHRALQRAPDNLSIRYHQAMIEAASGDTSNAVTMLEALLSEENNLFPERAEAASLLKSIKG